MGGKKASTTTSTTTPWAPQGDQLQRIFSEAGNLYNQYNNSYYDGPFTAGLNDTQRTALDQQLAAANASGQFADTTGQVAQNLSGSYEASRAINDALASGDPIAAELARRAMEDPTNGILQTAGQYADNPWITGMIDSVGRDVSRNLNENQLTSLNLGAAGMGNMNSSRAGAAEAILMRGAQDRMADISSSLRGDAWNNGLTMAANQRESMFRNALAASGQDINTRLAASQNYMNLGAAGTALGAMSLENRANQAAITGNVGNVLQAEEQRNIDENIRQFESREAADWTRLGNYYGIVGDKSWGGTTTTTQPRSGPSGLQTALGAVATIGGVVAAPFTGGASLSLTAAGLGALSSNPGAAGGVMSAAQAAYGGGGGGWSWSNPFGTSSLPKNKPPGL